MIDLPLQCYIEVDTESEAKVDVRTSKSVTGFVNQKVQSPNTLSYKLPIRYSGLSAADCRTVEDALRSTKGAMRVTYNSLRWRIPEGYEVVYGNTKHSITLILEQAA